MIEVEPLDVVAVPFPFVERFTVRQRPVAVIAAPPSDDRYPLLWVMMITSALNRPWPGDLLITDLESAGLRRPCLIRTAKIAAIENTAIDQWGRLATKDAAALREALRRMLQPLLRDVS